MLNKKVIIVMCISISLSIIAAIQYCFITGKMYNITYRSVGEDPIKYKMRKYLLGKELSIIGNIININPEKEPQKKILYVYDLTDCSSCVIKGFKISKDVMKKISNEKYYTIVLNATSMQDDALYKNNLVKYYDADGIFKKSIKNVYTPAILFLDESNKIVEVVFINNQMSNHILSLISEKIVSYINGY